MHISLACLVLSTAFSFTLAPQAPAANNLKAEIDSLNAKMTAAFAKDPGSVAAYYTDDALVSGGGQRFQGRAAVDGYWKGTTGFTGWTLETLDVGGPANAPWYYGKSVLTGTGGRTSVVHYVGLLRRDSSGELKFRADMFVRDRGETGADEGGKITEAWLSATQRGDAKALGEIFDDGFIILSSTARNKAQEIADLVPQPGVTLPYFKSEQTVTKGFGQLAVTSGILKWEYNGRAMERNYTSVAKNTPAGWKIVAQQVTPR
jgi:ketosteroid isomerase-like protein